MSSVPANTKAQAMAIMKPTSPSLVTRNAFFAARAASGLRNQKPMSRYELSPTSSQKTNRKTSPDAITSPSIDAVNSDM